MKQLHVGDIIKIFLEDGVKSRVILDIAKHFKYKVGLVNIRYCEAYTIIVDNYPLKICISDTDCLDNIYLGFSLHIEKLAVEELPITG